MAESQQFEVVDEFHPSYWAYSKWMWFTIITFPFTWGFPLLYPWWKRHHTKYKITDDNVIKEYESFAGKEQDIVPRDEINRVRTSQTAWERMKNRGTVIVESSTTTLELKGVSNHEDMMKRLSDF